MSGGSTEVGRSARLGLLILVAVVLAAALLPPAAMAWPKNALVSRADGPHGAIANNNANGAAITGNGRYVYFESAGTNLVPGIRDNAVVSRIYRRDMRRNRTTLVPGTLDGSRPAVTPDGRYLAYGRRLGEGDVQIFVRDLATGETEIVSRENGRRGARAGGSAGEAAISADGRYVTFSTTARNITGRKAGGSWEWRHPPTWLYVRDLKRGTTTLVSRADGPHGRPADEDAAEPSISAGGRYVAFRSSANNLGAPLHGPRYEPNVFVRDLRRNRTHLVSSWPAGSERRRKHEWSFSPSISADGRFVAFVADGVFRRDMVTGRIILVSRPDGVPAEPDTGSLDAHPAISADGSAVAFASDAALTKADSQNERLYLRDLTTGRTRLIGHRAKMPAISRDGRVVAYFKVVGELGGPDQTRAVYRWVRGPARRSSPGR